MRLNRFLASAGLGSRRAVEELITLGRVRINGEVVTKLATEVQPGDSVKVGSRLLRSEPYVYAVLNKPKRIVTSASDEKGRSTIFDLLPRNWPRVFHVGRLDMNSEGLLLVTNDGDLANALSHPRYKIEKEYEVTIDRPFEEPHREKLLRGVMIEDGKAKAEQLTVEQPTFLRVVLTQGMNRQIHKMLWRVGEYNVKRLVRVRIGPITARGIPPGKWRMLTRQELQELGAAVQGKRAK
jgi:23S rRNA pseudouridine2605 synthase